MWGFLGDNLSTSLLVSLGAVAVLLRFRRYKAVGAAAVGLFSSAATIGVAVVVVLFGLVALGYWEPPIGEIVGDAVIASRAVYDTVGEWMLRQTVERIKGIAV